LTDDDFDTLTKSTKLESSNVVEKKDKFDKNDIVYEDGDLFIVNKNA